jgi:hypothetical protein
MKDHIKLSKMPCYAGLWRAEVMEFTPDINGGNNKGVYLQFVEGCGYSVFELTTDEARELAQILVDKANQTDKIYAPYETTR